MAAAQRLVARPGAPTGLGRAAVRALGPGGGRGACSWLNMIEQWFSVLTRRVLRHGDFTSREDLEAKITAYTIRHNQTARPYKWAYDADADHARYLQRHAQPAAPTARQTRNASMNRCTRCGSLAPWLTAPGSSDGRHPKTAPSWLTCSWRR